MERKAGSLLGPYEIIARIGAGGMGEMWRARDTRLDRTVAIKILPAAWAHNAQLKLRLECEAKTISQLNHPHKRDKKGEDHRHSDTTCSG